MVLITLPLVSMSWTHWPTTVRAAAADGKPDPSPNAGLSESIFAHCSDVQMGGLNRYGNTWINKPLLSAQSDKATSSGVRKLLNLGLRLEVAWLIVAAGWSFLQ
jgi:adenosylcobinamide-phosphate synthase